MAVRTLPVEVEQSVYTGADWRRQYRWFPDGRTPKDFTGWHARMLIGPPRGEAVITLTDGNGITLDTDGLISLTLSDAQTMQLSGAQYAYVVDLIDDTGFIMRFLRGRMTVVADVYTDD